MNKGLITIISIFLLIFAGCSNGNGDNGAVSSGGITLNSFNGGDKAVEFTFAEGSPPEKIRDKGSFPFNIRLMITNVGEYDIEENTAHVALKGISASDLGVDDLTTSVPMISGTKKQGGRVREGGRQQVTFSNLKYVGDLGVGGVISQPLNAYICYPYKTLAQSTLCLSGNTYQSYDSEYSTCQIDSKREVASSGSPLSVENLEEYASGEHSVTFQFDIVHKPTQNQGRVFRSEVLDSSCNVAGNQPSSTDATLEEDYVSFTVATGLPGLECSNSENGDGTGSVQLGNDNKMTVICTQDTEGLEEQEKLVKISLDYDYLERIQTSLTVEHYGN